MRVVASKACGSFVDLVRVDRHHIGHVGTAVDRRQADVGDRAEVGPYVSLRPGANLASGAKAGTFVEIKNSSLGPGSKAAHLGYIGDADVGAGVNFSCGAIVVNYDGYRKSKTVIGERAFIGSDTQLVAPVTVGADAVVGAGTTVVKDVPPGALALARAQQLAIPGYAERKRRLEAARKKG